MQVFAQTEPLILQWLAVQTYQAHVAGKLDADSRVLDLSSELRGTRLSLDSISSQIWNGPDQIAMSTILPAKR